MISGKNILVTGGAGFIGSNLVRRLVDQNNVTVYDNLSRGKLEHIQEHLSKPGFKFIKADLLDTTTLSAAMKGIDIVFHLAANADIQYGTDNPRFDLEQNVLATYNVLEAMQKRGVTKLVFSSTSTTFGHATILPTPESYGPALPESLYGASKLACEGFISAYCSLFDMQAWVFRFANIIGPNVTHGILADFVKKLRTNRYELEVLGDGKQTKSYLHVADCVDAMLFAIEKSDDRVNLFNLGSDDQITVKEISEIAIRLLAPGAKIKYTGGERGWKGDVPKMFLANSKIKALGWKPKYTSREAVIESIKTLKL